jgi:surface protein
MINVEFIYKTSPTIIQTTKEESMRHICEKFASKADINIKLFYFLYNGGKIDLNLTLKKQATKDDLKLGQLKIVVCSYEDGQQKDEPDFMSDDIICQVCHQICFLDFDEYKIKFYGCQKNHTLNTSINQYNETQKIDKSEITCNSCKEKTKDSMLKNKFYKCLTCGYNLCLLCKQKHYKEHNIVDFDQQNYRCKIHYEKYNSYCKKCNQNLCLLCVTEHKGHSNIINFSDIMPKIDIIQKQISEIRNRINTFKEKAKEVISILNRIEDNFETYYNINNNIINNYISKNINIQILNNIKNIRKNNIKILSELNKIVYDNTVNFFNSSVNIFNKMDNEISPEYSARKNEIIAKYEINKDAKKIKIFGCEFVKNNKNNFDLFIKGRKYNFRDELDKVFWSDKDKIIEITIREKNRCTNMKNMFSGCSSLIAISNKSTWDTSNVTDMSFMFYGCKRLRELPNMSSWNTANVKDMSHMFRECLSIEIVDQIEKLNTSKVTNMSYMFYECSSMISLGSLDKWDTSNVTDISYMFYKCTLFPSLPDISKWNTRNLIDISYLFFDCRHLSEISDISNWDTSKVIKMNNLFYGCSLLTSLPDI